MIRGTMRLRTIKQLGIQIHDLSFHLGNGLHEFFTFLRAHPVADGEKNDADNADLQKIQLHVLEAEKGVRTHRRKVNKVIN
jgi:hypothetical protein